MVVIFANKSGVFCICKAKILQATVKLCHEILAEIIRGVISLVEKVNQNFRDSCETKEG